MQCQGRSTPPRGTNTSQRDGSRVSLQNTKIAYNRTQIEMYNIMQLVTSAESLYFHVPISRCITYFTGMFTL